MKKRFIRHNFNMVEIMLAVIVIALGITGTFVLFPVGVNANKSAVADNSIADIAEYVTSFVRAEVLAACRPPDEDNDETNDDDKDKEDTFKSFKQSVVNKKFHNSGTAYKGAIDDVDDPSGWTELKNGNPISTILEHSSEKGVFLIRQLSGPEDNRFVDFAAVARVYLDRNDDESTGLEKAYFPKFNNEEKRTEVLNNDEVVFDNPESDDKNVLQSCFLPAVLELSWPATVPFEEREKRYFRFEIFNDYYRL